MPQVHDPVLEHLGKVFHVCADDITPSRCRSSGSNSSSSRMSVSVGARIDRRPTRETGRTELGAMMLDTKARLLEAQQALHHLELKAEQYRIHIAELADGYEIEQAEKVLDKIRAEIEVQRRYCDLLAKAEGASGVEANSGSAHAA